jgi:hypothetical protein
MLLAQPLSRASPRRVCGSVVASAGFRTASLPQPMTLTANTSPPPLSLWDEAPRPSNLAV